MSTSTEIKKLLDEATALRLFSGYQLHATGGSQSALLCHGGVTSYWPGGKPVDARTLFDLGSLTKVIVTTSAIARAVDAQRIALEDEIVKHVPELGGAYAKITLADLLSHRSGAVWWHPFFRETNRKDLLAFCAAHAKELLVRPRGQEAVYSDVGFVLLGFAIEKWYGDLKKAFAAEIAGPLGLVTTVYGPVPREKCAATEYSLEEEGVVWGDVFDENARALGQACPHAGLFGTAAELCRFGEAWRDAVAGKSLWLGQATAKRFTARGNTTWALGWDTPSRPISSSGSRFSDESFGMLGYPGTSLWVDPQVGGVVAFVTNRVHPSRYDDRIRQLRPRLHDGVAALWRQ